MDSIRTGLSYGDVLLVPHRSPVESRSEVDLSTPLTPEITIENPLLSAPMDTVTEAETAIALSAIGGFGTIHRFMTVEEQAAEVARVADAGERVGAAVGISEDYRHRADLVLEAGADLIMVDVAHGHLEKSLDAVETLAAEFPDVEVVAGNVGTAEAVEDLYAVGVDAVKVGIGPGSHCTTRKVAGAGVPQVTAIDDTADVAHDLGMTVIADGGIRNSGDAVKALMAGADTVMMGRLFAGTEESPGEIIVRGGERYKRSRGMATTAANDARTDKDDSAPMADEGVEALTPYSGPLEEIVEEFLSGMRSGLSYVGGTSIPEARAKAEFIRAAPSAQEREGAHFDHDWESPSAD
jgi:IMP dehydrogenase